MLKNKIINILWIVNDLYVNNFVTVYKECKKDKRFKLTILATRHIGLYKTDDISSYKVYKFLQKNKIKSINSWNKDKKKYIEISSFDPDYIFTTTPYDIYLPTPYKSINLVKYGKLCQVEYGASIIKYSGLYKNYIKKNEFFKNTWTLFTSKIPEYKKELPCKYKPIGYLKLDEYLHYKRVPKYPWHNNKALKIVWKPRWTLEKEDSKLLNYLDKFYFLIKNNKKIDFVFLFHPLLISNLKNKHKIKFFNHWINKYKKLSNFNIENGSNFLDCVLSADILISGHSSTLAEFATTGKPIIYINTKAELNELGRRIINVSYITNNFTEIKNTIKKLINKNDPLKIKRGILKKKYFKIPPNKKTIAQYLLSYIYKDYYFNKKSESFIKRIFKKITFF